MGSSVIAVGGPHGSGKSSVAKRLADELDMEYISAGDVFREMADERQLTLKEFSKVVVDKPGIDREIDQRTRKLSEKGNTVVDAQLAAHFTPDDAELKICITAAPDIRYSRIAKREGISLQEARNETEIREASEKKRFLDLYGIDIDDLSNYDVVINNDRLSLEETYQICKAAVLSIFKPREINKLENA